MVSLRISEIGYTPDDIFNVLKGDFVALASDIFKFQYQNNEVYRRFCDLNKESGQWAMGSGQWSAGSGQRSNRLLDKGNHPSLDNNLPFETDQFQLKVPFLPISFFKTHSITSFGEEAEKVFTSSGTSGSETSRHYIWDLGLYEESFTRGFHHFYGDPAQYAFLCLLPSYLEREGSSLIYMAKRLIELSGQPDSGFFLKAEGKLVEILYRREKAGLKTILLGVSFALLDFAERFSMPLRHTIIMETGGMKGRRRELTRAELHGILQKSFGVASIQSEYGMTELMSQAYSKGEGRYQCPPWMRVYVRDEDDPFSVHNHGAGLLCIADLANVHSCSFIETSDAGRVFEDGSFEVLGRMDNSDIRGCSLLVV